MSILEEYRLAVATKVDPPPARPRWRRWRLPLLALALVVGYALLPLAVRLGQDVQLRLPVDAGLAVPEFGDRGTTFLQYQHHETVTMGVPVTNRTPVPMSIRSVRVAGGAYPLVEPVFRGGLPVTLGPFERATVDVTLRFTNCRYYHERATQTLHGVVVEGSTLGRSFTETVSFDRPLTVHAQTIVDCPDRTLVRGDDARPR